MNEPKRRHIHHELPRVKKRTLTLIVIIVVVAFAILFVVGFLIRHHRVAHREKMAKEIREQPLVVQVVAPKPTQKAFDLSLPADLRAFATTALYARTNGFLATWTADINDQIKKGQVLAVISAPDTDAELEQAEAALDQQQSGRELSKLTDQRFRGLIPIQGVTQQQLDQNRSNLDQASSNVKSASAGVDRLKALVAFEKIVAPYDGVVTARNYDVGALISASNIGAGQELFDVAQADRLRVFVNVPQPYVELIAFGQQADLALERNFPGHKFTGVITRATGALDPVTRTLRTEIDFDNRDPKFRLYPGMYGEVTFHIQRERPVLTVPTSALMFEANGKQVAIVTPDNKIHFQPIVPGSDFGTEIEIVSGLKGDEKVVANPGEQLTEGIAVSPQTGGGDDKKGDNEKDKKADAGK